MIKVHILTDKFSTQNSRAFLFPLLVNKSMLLEKGISFSLFYNVSEYIYDCDVMMVTSKYYGIDWDKNKGDIIKELKIFSTRVKHLVYCDIHDSTGLIRTEVLPYVSKYLKSHLLKNRMLYKNPFYGGRIYTDYYYNNGYVQDSQPQYSKPISDINFINKLDVSWNMGLYNYGYFGKLVDQIITNFPFINTYNFPRKFTSPSISRPRDLFAYFGTSYKRESISYQRKKIKEKLYGKISVEKVPRWKYFKEIHQSKLVISPFGWGEFALRDYETFMAGALLLKPNMDHLETYPNFYQDNKTMISHRWDLSNLEDKLDWASSNKKLSEEISINGQEFYRTHSYTIKGKEMFTNYFSKLIYKII